MISYRLSFREYQLIMLCIMRPCITSTQSTSLRTTNIDLKILIHLISQFLHLLNQVTKDVL